MIIVLDTNVLIAAFIAHGVCSDLLEHCVRRHRLVTSAFILEEFHRVMVDRLRYSAEEAQEAIELLRSRAMLVAPAELGTTVCRDKDDDAVLGTAVAGDAACIITGDSDLLVIKHFRGIDIVRPTDFAEYEATHSP